MVVSFVGGISKLQCLASFPVGKKNTVSTVSCANKLFQNIYLNAYLSGLKNSSSFCVDVCL